MSTVKAVPTRSVYVEHNFSTCETTSNEYRCRLVMPAVAKVLADLTRKIAGLDEQIAATRASLELKVRKREGLATTVRVLREEFRLSSGEEIRTSGRRDPRKPATVTSEEVKSEPKMPRRRQADSMAAAIRAIVEGIAAEFTAAEVTRIVAKERPDLAAIVPAGYISSLLWRMAKDKRITITKHARKGGGNTYLINRNP